ncbi:hypothetical protein TNCV_4445951 [Trichonephila clavipes]|nr:hypothetical protein TNCV_4445951 [Trichonephila clavipes]
MRKRVPWNLSPAHPNPSPMNGKHRRFVLLGRDLLLSPGSGNRRRKRGSRFLNRRPELYRGKISMRSTKDQH